MTIEEARQLVGNAVVYRPRSGMAEQGIVTSVNDRYVFVRYGASPAPQATNPADLEALGE